VECKNHALRCLNKNLRLLLRQTAYPLSQRRELGSKADSIGKYCVYAIEGAKENFPTRNPGYLRLALKNCLEHVYGVHANCPDYICRNGKVVIPSVYRTGDFHIPDGEKTQVSDVPYRLMKDTAIWREISKHIGRLVSMSSYLIRGQTTNRSECFQGQFSKFLQGKRKNVCYRGAYKKKCGQTLLADEHGSGYYAFLLRKAIGKSPLAVVKSFERTSLRERARQKLRGRRTRGLNPLKVSAPALDADYGDGAKQPDIPDNDLKDKIDDLIKSYQLNNVVEQWKIHLETVGQFESQEYRHQRQFMLTASNAGKICSMRDATDSTNMIKQLLSSSFLGNSATLWGKEHEIVAFDLYKRSSNMDVHKAGLFRSLEFPMLAASPDGLIGEDGLIEIKCPFVERHKMPRDLIKRKASYVYLEGEGHDQHYLLKKTHEYYTQVIMQLHITNRSWCDFVVWTQGPLNDLGEPETPEGHIITIRIYKSAETLEKWETVKEKLIRFFLQDLAPEIVDSRVSRNMKIRQPGYRVEAKRRLEKRHQDVLPVARKLTYPEESPDDNIPVPLIKFSKIDP